MDTAFNMDITIKHEVVSDGSDAEDPLGGESSEQEYANALPEHSCWDGIVPVTDFIKCEYESESDDDSKQAERVAEPENTTIAGIAALIVPYQQQAETPTAQPGDTATPPEVDRRHQCLYCLKYFSSTSVLKKHWRQHTGEKPYGCNVCNRRFTHNSSFRRHLVTHTGEKPYECSICQNRFTQESSLRTHLRTHTDEKPFECGICHKHFARKYHLEEHSRVHTADKPYACNYCQRRFTRKFSLGKHIRSRCSEAILSVLPDDLSIRNPPDIEVLKKNTPDKC